MMTSTKSVRKFVIKMLYINQKNIYIGLRYWAIKIWHEKYGVNSKLRLLFKIIDVLIIFYKMLFFFKIYKYYLYI